MAKQSWHLDRKVPIGILAALVCNIFLGGYLLSKVISRLDSQDSRLDNYDKRFAKIDEIFERRATIGEQWVSRLTTVETEFLEFRKTIEAAIINIDTNIEKIKDKQYGIKTAHY